MLPAGVMVFRRAQDCGLFKVMEVFVTVRVQLVFDPGDSPCSAQVPMPVFLTFLPVLCIHSCLQGDTAINMYSLVNNITLERPMVHDVMFWVSASIRLQTILSILPARNLCCLPMIFEVRI